LNSFDRYLVSTILLGWKHESNGRVCWMLIYVDKVRTVWEITGR
jgi:hypothetical protein